MKKTFLCGCLFVIFFSLSAQQTPAKNDMLRDTVRLREVTVSSTIPLNNKQIEKFYKTNYYSTIDNLTSHLEGISLIKRGSYAMEPQLNGFSGGQLNITISGMKMFGACTDKMDPVTSYIEPANLKSITLESGTNGGLFGNNIGGSIDLALQEPDTKSAHPFYTNVSLGYETVSASRNILISTGYTKNKWAWGLNGVYRKNDSYRAGSGEKVAFSQFEKSNIHSVVKYMPDSISSCKVDLLYDMAGNIGYPALPMDVSKARAAIIAFEYQRITRNKEIKAKVYYNSVFHVMDDSHRDSLFFISNKISAGKDSVYMRMDMPGRSNTFGSFLQATIKLNNKNTLIVKADNYINSSLAEMTMHMHFPGSPPEKPMYLQTWPDILRNVTGLFIQNTMILSRKASLAANARVDYNIDKLQSSIGTEQFSVFNYNMSRSFQKPTKSFNLSLLYHPARILLFTIQTGFSERIPTISERFGYYLYNAYDGYDYIGNPDLKTEKSFSGNLSLTYYNKGLKANLSQSFNFLKNYIMGVTNSVVPSMNFYANGLRVYQNVNGAQLNSTNLQLMYSPSDELTLYMLTKYTWAQLNSGEPVPLIPPLNNVISICYEKSRWGITAENETAFIQNRINPDYGEKRSPSFTIFNVKGSYHFMFKGIMLDSSIGITNLFDVNYYEHLDWGQIPDRAEASISSLSIHTESEMSD